MALPPLDSLPGFRRRFLVTTGPGWVRSDVEDDFHCMSVTLRHDGGIVTAVEPVMERAPWTTCPGAVAQLKKTFAGIALGAFVERGEKSANCTHLHDLALLAAAHFKDHEPLVYDILVTDPIDGKSRAELRRNGITVMSWVHINGQIIEPAEFAGAPLSKMRTWIDALDPKRREEARLFRWGTLIAMGRSMMLSDKIDPSRMPAGACYTFQPDMVPNARRVGLVRDFSKGAARPLDKHEAVA